MLAVAVARRAREERDDDLGPEPALDPEGVFEQDLPRPEAQRLVERSREAEVVGAREILARAVDPPRAQQFLRPDQTERNAEVAADQVLTTFAAGQRQVGHLGAHLPRDDGQESVVLVVRVRADDEHPLVHRETLQQPIERDETAGGGRLERDAGGGSGDRRGRGPSRRRGEAEEEQKERERGFLHSGGRSVRGQVSTCHIGGQVSTCHIVKT